MASSLDQGNDKEYDDRNVLRGELDGCADDKNQYIGKEDEESLDVIMKKAGFSGVASGIRRHVSAKRKFPPSCDSKVKFLSLDESKELLAASVPSKSNRRREADGKSQRNPPEKMRKRRSLLEESLAASVQSNKKRCLWAVKFYWASGIISPKVA